MTQPKVRIGLIGCGGIARGHLESIAAHPGATLAAVCDVNPAAALEAQSIGSGHDAPATVYNDYTHLLANEELDAVYLCLPPFVHGDIELELVERGLPFLVQKPVALNLGLANKIAAAVREKNLLTCVGYQLRYSASADAARAAVAGQAIGLVNGTYWCGTGRATVGRWLQRKSQSGGQLVEQATHTIDMMRYLGGEVESVFCWQDLRILDKAETDCPDVNVLSLRYKSGALGAFSCTWALEGNDWNNANIVDMSYGDSRLRWKYGHIEITRGGETREESGPNRSIDEVFIHAVATGDRSAILSDYDEGLRTLAVSLAADESARTGQPVNVDEFIATQG